MRRFNPERELRKIQHGGRNKTIAFVFLLLVVSVVSYSFALYQVRYSKRIIYTKVAPFSTKDIQLAVKVEGEEGSLDYFPPKEDSYVYVKTECEKEDVTEVEWKEADWKLNLLTSGPNKCTVTFRQIKYNVTTEVSGGHATVEPASQDVVKGKNSEVFTVNPEEGYGVEKVTCDNSQQATLEGNTFYLTNVTNDTKCTVKIIKKYVITTEIKANGNVSPDKQYVMPNEDSKDFTVTPTSGYGLGDVTCDNGQQVTIEGNKFHLTNVTSDTKCTIDILKEYTVRAKVTANGDVEPKTQKALANKDTEDFTVTPNKGYGIKEISCTNGEVSRTGNTFKVTKVTEDSVCTVTLSPGTPFSDIIVANNSTIYDDETDQHNLRYVGADPSNYIWFNCNDYSKEMDETNCEKWRIIGLFKKVPKPGGTTEDLVKIIRADSVGQGAWDDSIEYGINDWSKATLQINLNKNYLTINDDGSWIESSRDSKYKPISEKSQAMVETVIWNLGGTSSFSGTPSKFYTLERGTTHYGNNPTTWPGKIGLVYPSDYGFATEGGDDKSRDDCLNTSLNYYKESSCYNNNWLNKTGWSLTTMSGYEHGVFTATGWSRGDTSGHNAYLTYNITPTLYLTSNTKISTTGGDGSSTTPYILIP